MPMLTPSLSSQPSHPSSHPSDFPDSPQTELYAIAGHILAMDVDDEKLLAVTQSFARAHWLTLAPGSGNHNVDQDTPAARISLFCHAHIPALPSQATPLALAQGCAFIASSTIFISVAEAVLVIEAEACAPLKIYLRADTSSATAAVLLTHAVHAALRRLGSFELHAAALRSPAEKTGIFLIGDSGSGKTTLTVKLALQGWGFLTDDSLLLQEEATQLVARPLRRVVALTPETLAACGWREDGPAGVKQLRDPAQIFQAQPLPALVPQHLVFPRIAPQATSQLVPLTQANALMGLLRQSAWACFDAVTSAEHLSRLTRLARATSAWELRAGRDLLETPEAAAQLLATLNHPA